MKILTALLLQLLIQLFPGSSSFASAQVDPAKVRVGRWEGTVETRNPESALIINSVSPKDDVGGLVSREICFEDDDFWQI